MRPPERRAAPAGFVPGIDAPADPTASIWLYAFVGGQVALPDGRSEAFAPVSAALLATAPDRRAADAPLYLGRLDGLDCWAVTRPEPPPGWLAVGLRAALMHWSAAQMAVAGRAAQLVEWRRTHRHCGVCGTPTVVVAGERAVQCPACGHRSYPRINPAMMALVWRPGELLLARAPSHAPGRYTALAGFVEAGESIEECVHREIAEEVGVQVQDLRYYGSQSWPFPHSLMVAYTARWAGGPIVPQESEIEDARWFAVDALPPVPPRFSISGHLIDDTARRIAAREPGWT